MLEIILVYKRKFLLECIVVQCVIKIKWPKEPEEPKEPQFCEAEQNL